MQGGAVASDNHRHFSRGVLSLFWVLQTGSGLPPGPVGAFFVWGYLLLIIDYSCIHFILFRVAFIVCKGLVFFDDIMGCSRVQRCNGS